MNTSEKIKKLRIEKGLSQEALGKLIGVQRAAINKYEKGTVVNIKRSTLQKLAVALGVSPADLLDDEEYGYSYAPDVSVLTKLKAAVGLPLAEKEAVKGVAVGKIIDAWLSLSDEGQEQLIQYAEFLLSKEDK